MKTRGFTLVELVIVIAITGLLAASVTLFLKPTIDGYVDARRRAELTDMADTALRRMSQDIRSAVPNSLMILSGGTCMAMAPTTTGGRYRMAPDTVAAGSAWMDNGAMTPGAAGTGVFDVLSPLTTTPPAVGDWVVVDPERADGVDVYTAGGQRLAIAAPIGTPATGLHRITVAAAKFTWGSPAGRFVVIDHTAPVVVYSCAGGTLFRNVVAPIATPTAAACGAVAVAATVATDLDTTGGAAGCVFSYNSGAGRSVQKGLVRMGLTLTSNGETISLFQAVHVENAP